MNWYKTGEKIPKERNMRMFECPEGHMFIAMKQKLIKRAENNETICVICDGWETIDEYQNNLIGRGTVDDPIPIEDKYVSYFWYNCNFIWSCSDCKKLYKSKIQGGIKIGKCSDCSDGKAANLCMAPGCNTRANFTRPGKKMKLTCSNQKCKDSFETKDSSNSRICQVPECTTMASWGKLGFGKRLYCSEHKTTKPGLIDLASTKCKCGRHAGFILGNGMVYCGVCGKAEAEKTNLELVCKNAKCACGKAYPSFNHKVKPARYCSQCKPEGAINVAQTMCLECGKFAAHYGNEGEIARYCGSCAKPRGMVLTHKYTCETLN